MAVAKSDMQAVKEFAAGPMTNTEEQVRSYLEGLEESITMDENRIKCYCPVNCKDIPYFKIDSFPQDEILQVNAQVQQEQGKSEPTTKCSEEILSNV
jgi:hypothetical protein